MKASSAETRKTARPCCLSFFADRRRDAYGDLAHGVVEGEAEDLDVEVNGIASQVALRPAASRSL